MRPGTTLTTDTWLSFASCVIPKLTLSDGQGRQSTTEKRGARQFSDQLQIVIIEFSTVFLKIRICFGDLNLNNIPEIPIWTDCH